MRVQAQNNMENYIQCSEPLNTDGYDVKDETIYTEELSMIVIYAFATFPFVDLDIGCVLDQNWQNSSAASGIVEEP